MLLHSVFLYIPACLSNGQYCIPRFIINYIASLSNQINYLCDKQVDFFSQEHLIKS